MSEIEYTMKPVEVFYRGFRFRSRLEACWAAFFDLCKWPWEYEPADFDGWFPDFVLLGEKGNRIFVEVKPIAEEYLALQGRIDRSGCQDECLIVGLCPTLLCTDGFSDECRLGWLREGDWWSEAVLFRPTTEKCGCSKLNDREIASRYPIDFCHALGSYELRMSGLYDGDHYLGLMDRDEVCQCWGLAHEMTRYDPL